MADVGAMSAAVFYTASILMLVGVRSWQQQRITGTAGFNGLLPPCCSPAKYRSGSSRSRTWWPCIRSATPATRAGLADSYPFLADCATPPTVPPTPHPALGAAGQAPVTPPRGCPVGEQ